MRMYTLFVLAVLSYPLSILADEQLASPEIQQQIVTRACYEMMEQAAEQMETAIDGETARTELEMLELASESRHLQILRETLPAESLAEVDGNLLGHNIFHSCLSPHKTVWSNAGHGTRDSQDWDALGHDFDLSWEWDLAGHHPITSRDWENVGHSIRYTQIGHVVGNSDEWEEIGHQYFNSRGGHDVEVSLNHDVELSEEWDESDHDNIWSWTGHADTLSEEQSEGHETTLSQDWFRDNHNWVYSYRGHNTAVSNGDVPPAPAIGSNGDSVAEWSEVVTALSREN